MVWFPWIFIKYIHKLPFSHQMFYLSFSFNLHFHPPSLMGFYLSVIYSMLENLSLITLLYLSETKILCKLESINIFRINCHRKSLSVRKFLLGWVIIIFNNIQLIKATKIYYKFQKTVKTFLKTNLLMRWLGFPSLIPIFTNNCHLWSEQPWFSSEKSYFSQ